MRPNRARLPRQYGGYIFFGLLSAIIGLIYYANIGESSGFVAVRSTQTFLSWRARVQANLRKRKPFPLANLTLSQPRPERHRARLRLSAAACWWRAGSACLGSKWKAG